MLKDITLGQYFPGTSVVHRLDARTKLILVLLYIVALFQAKSWWSYGLVLLDSQYKGDASLEMAGKLVGQCIAPGDKDSWRARFLALIEKAQSLQ